MSDAHVRGEQVLEAGSVSSPKAGHLSSGQDRSQRTLDLVDPVRASRDGTKPEWWSSDEWSTPPAYFAELNARFGPFDLDPCARPETAKAPTFYTKADNGLTHPWFGRVFCNPPYSEPKKWCAKARDESMSGRAILIVMLLPAAVDTHWFHDLVLPFADVEFIRGRLRFHGWQGTPIGSPTAGNVLGIYPSTNPTHKIDTMGSASRV